MSSTGPSPMLRQWADMTQRASRAGEAVEDPDLPEDWREALRQASDLLVREVDRLLKEGPTRPFSDSDSDSGNPAPLRLRLQQPARSRLPSDQ